MKILAITGIIAVTVLLVKVIDVAVPRAAQRAETTHVDTLRVVTTVYDTVTVISRAADTIKIRIKDVGPLNVQDVVRLVCGELAFGDKRDADGFGFNAYGMVFCPVAPKDAK